MWHTSPWITKICHKHKLTILLLDAPSTTKDRQPQQQPKSVHQSNKQQTWARHMGNVSSQMSDVGGVEAGQIDKRPWADWFAYGNGSLAAFFWKGCWKVEREKYITDLIISALPKDIQKLWVAFTFLTSSFECTFQLVISWAYTV